MKEGLVFSAFSAFPVIKMLFPRVFRLFVAPFFPSCFEPSGSSYRLRESSTWQSCSLPSPLLSTSQRKRTCKCTEVERCWQTKNSRAYKLKPQICISTGQAGCTETHSCIIAQQHFCHVCYS